MRRSVGDGHGPGPLGLYSDPLHAEAHELRERLQRAEAQLAELKA